MNMSVSEYMGEKYFSGDHVYTIHASDT